VDGFEQTDFFKSNISITHSLDKPQGFEQVLPPPNRNPARSPALTHALHYLFHCGSSKLRVRGMGWLLFALSSAAHVQI